MENPTLDVQVLSGDLRAALANVKRAINPRTSLPILTYGMVETDNGRLTLSGTNLEWAISYTISAKVAGEGRAVIPVHQLAASLPAKPAGPVHITANGKDVSVTLPSGATLTYHTAEPDDYPNTAMPAGSLPVLVFGGQHLKRAIEAVERCAARDRERPILDSILMQVEADEIVFVAADSFRLAVYHYFEGETYKNSTACGKKFIIPAGSLRTLASMIGKGEGDVTMWLEPDSPAEKGYNPTLGRITFASGDWRLTTAQVFGVYPNWQAIMPKGKGENIILVVADTLAAVKQLAPIAKLGNNILRFSANGEGPDICTVTATGDGQQATLRIPCRRYPDNPWKVALDARYLRDTLETIGSEQASVTITSSSAPVHFLAWDEPLETIVMPMYVAD